MFTRITKFFVKPPSGQRKQRGKWTVPPKSSTWFQKLVCVRNSKPAGLTKVTLWNESYKTQRLGGTIWSMTGQYVVLAFFI